MIYEKKRVLYIFLSLQVLLWFHFRSLFLRVLDFIKRKRRGLFYDHLSSWENLRILKVGVKSMELIGSTKGPTQAWLLCNLISYSLSKQLMEREGIKLWKQQVGKGCSFGGHKNVKNVCRSSSVNFITRRTRVEELDDHATASLTHSDLCCIVWSNLADAELCENLLSWQRP